MIDVRFRPIDRWPGERTPANRRANPTFRASYMDTLELLERELRYLRARDIVIQAGLTLDQIRNDGWPRSGSTFTDPGVILSFRSPTGDLSFPCDRYPRFDANMRAIALSLEALRAVDRYGVTRRAEQYQGWRQIEAPGSVAPQFANATAAALFVSAQSDVPADEILRSASLRKLAFRKAAARLHPDQAQGSHEQFVTLQQAIAILEATR